MPGCLNNYFNVFNMHSEEKLEMSIYPMMTVLGMLLLFLHIHRSFFHPVCLQSALWFSQLGILWMLQNEFDHISSGTLWLIAGGVAGFGLGGTVVALLFNPPNNSAKHTIAAKDFTIPLLVVFPLLLYAINMSVPFTMSFSYFKILNESLPDAEVINFGYIGTLILLLNVYIVTIYTCRTENRFALPLAILVYIILSLIIGSKGFLLFLTGSLLFSGYYTKQLRFRHITAGILVLICFFAAITFMRTGNKTDSDFYSTALKVYTVSAIPALDQQIHSFYSRLDNNTFRTVYLWLNKIGFNFDIPPVVADFVFVPYPTNVFTYLYPYYIDFGFFGAILICFFLGACHGYFHIMAVNGSVRHIIFASLLSFPLLMQFFSDQYFMWMSNWIYFVIVIVLCTRIQFSQPSAGAVN